MDKQQAKKVNSKGNNPLKAKTHSARLAAKCNGFRFISNALPQESAPNPPSLVFPRLFPLDSEKVGKVNRSPHLRRSGETGRRTGLKIQRGQPRVSSILTSGTKKFKGLETFVFKPFFCFTVRADAGQMKLVMVDYHHPLKKTDPHNGNRVTRQGRKRLAAGSTRLYGLSRILVSFTVTV